MVKRMKLWVVGALFLTVVGGAVASNMGFKFVPNLNAVNSAFPIAIPFNHNYTNADSIFTDIQASGCNPALVERISGTGEKGFTTWHGFGQGDPNTSNFAVKVGEALDFWVNAPVSWTPAHY